MEFPESPCKILQQNKLRHKPKVATYRKHKTLRDILWNKTSISSLYALSKKAFVKPSNLHSFGRWPNVLTKESESLWVHRGGMGKEHNEAWGPFSPSTKSTALHHSSHHWKVLDPHHLCPHIAFCHAQWNAFAWSGCPWSWSGCFLCKAAVANVHIWHLRQQHPWPQTTAPVNNNRLIWFQSETMATGTIVALNPKP